LKAELSEKGKGRLRATWQEIVAEERLKTDEYKMKVMTDAGMSRLNEMISKMKGFIANKRNSALYGGYKGGVSLTVKGAKIEDDGRISVHVGARALSGSRPQVKHKGLNWGPDPNSLDLDDSGSNPLTHPEDTLTHYWIPIKGATEEDYVRPWIVMENDPDNPRYGEAAQIKEILANQNQAKPTSPYGNRT
jgi:hypothetical protein